MTLKAPYFGRQRHPIREVEAVPTSRHTVRIDFRIRGETLDEINRQFLLDPHCTNVAEYMRKVMDAGLKSLGGAQ